MAEFPVETKGAATRIDFVLHGKSEFSGIAAYMVCECKRPNPAINQWAFVRAPYTRRNRRERFAVFEGIWIEPTTGLLISAPSKLRDLVEPYDLGIELRGEARGESQGAGRGAIEDAATQVFLGVNGLIDFFKDNPRVLTQQAIVVPVIFTTARLSHLIVIVKPVISRTLSFGLPIGSLMFFAGAVYPHQHDNRNIAPRAEHPGPAE